MIPLVLVGLFALNLGEEVAYGDYWRAAVFAFCMVVVVALRRDLMPIRAGD